MLDFLTNNGPVIEGIIMALLLIGSIYGGFAMFRDWRTERRHLTHPIRIFDGILEDKDWS